MPFGQLLEKFDDDQDHSLLSAIVTLLRQYSANAPKSPAPLAETAVMAHDEIENRLASETVIGEFVKSKAYAFAIPTATKLFRENKKLLRFAIQIVAPMASHPSAKLVVESESDWLKMVHRTNDHTLISLITTLS